MRSQFNLIGAAILLSAFTQISAQAQEQKIEPSAAVAPTTPNTAIQRRRVPDTLMFGVDEYNEIKARIAGGDVTKEVREQEAGNQPLYLGSIMYYGPKEWTIWINGSPVGPNQDFQTFQITQITPRYVELLVPLSVQGMRPVRLEPNQTFIAESGIVIEGRYP